ncbi:MAG: hypothetical protein COY19_07600 [Candidatus Marinimicrobia bacterium CG_4_10_14_0_2_um_filter_48_9]|nr:MAG: hypothetical protein COY19_07600 [Candidatus Marinimicrobia bacterium CG_4_10_14_0_2_um_filter_48_9]
MNLSKKDYTKLYLLQDKFLSWWVTLGFPFYLTGGTALGRFYLNHRYSEDLDFFINADPQYPDYIALLIREITTPFTVNIQQSLFAGDFTRLFITEAETFLKIELVNDVAAYRGTPTVYPFGMIDTPANILSNKLSAIAGRDEPKDIFDIIHLSLKYSFSWLEMFEHAKQKALINELDIAQRMVSFPVEWLESVNWLKDPFDYDKTRKLLSRIADDFLLGRSNSLGKHCPPIETAKPLARAT